MDKASLDHDDSIGTAGDHYTQPADGVQEPPRTFRETLKLSDGAMLRPRN